MMLKEELLQPFLTQVAISYTTTAFLPLGTRIWLIRFVNMRELVTEEKLHVRCVSLTLIVLPLPVEFFLQVVHLLSDFLDIQHLQNQVVYVLHAGVRGLSNRVLWVLWRVGQLGRLWIWKST